jgi:hypothetical protein
MFEMSSMVSNQEKALR